MVTVRNYIAGEHLPWTQEDIGWNPEDFEPEWVWLVFVDREMTALLITAKVLNSVLLLRLLSKPGRAWWIRDLWSVVRNVCGKRKIVGFWSFMDNGREAERKLLALLAEGRCSVSPRVTEAGGANILVRGRF